MKAAIYTEKGNLQCVDMPLTEFNEDEGALIKVNGCGLCGSDIVKVQKNLVEPGTVLGHEVVGTIEKMGKNTSSKLKPGDRVALAHHVPCFACRYCKQSSFSMCESFKTSNLVPGGFSEYIYITRRHLQHTTIKVPQGTTDLTASAMEPLGCILRALERSKISEGQNVMVIGLGFIGLLFVQALKLYRSYVIACDLIDERVELALKLGCDIAFNPSKIENISTLINNTEKEIIDTVILASGSVSSIEMALKTVRDGGKIIVFASIPDDVTGYANNEIYYRELSVIGAYSSAPAFLGMAMNLLGCGKIKVEEFSTVMPIENINEALEKTVSNRALKVYLTL
jgi:L-iditol 2-dehydrogenase